MGGEREKERDRKTASDGGSCDCICGAIVLREYFSSAYVFLQASTSRISVSLHTSKSQIVRGGHISLIRNALFTST